MKKIYFILFLVLYLFNSCSTRNSEVDNIEFMAYMWSSHTENGEITDDFVKCQTYSFIDKNGNATLYRRIFYPKPDSVFFRLTIDKQLINDIIAESEIEDTTRVKFDPERVQIYDGPSIRIRINYHGTRFKSVTFNLSKTNEDYIYEHGQNSKNLPYLKLWYLIDSTFVTGKYEKTKDIIEIQKRRNNFINFTANIDTINPVCPRPPRIPNQIKFIAPK